MAKRDWLSREHRLRVAELAINWLGDQKIDAHRFGCACVVIERYLIDGALETAKLHHDTEEPVVVTFEKLER